MAASTRADILATARELFTRYGYHHVSMRSISDVMGISVGNLTYHFPRKADLADALLEQEMQRILMLPRPGLDALDQCLRGILSSLLEYARLFSDTAMFQSVPTLAHGHRDRIIRLRAMLLAMLQAQADAGLLDPGAAGKPHRPADVQPSGLAAAGGALFPAAPAGHGTGHGTPVDRPAALAHPRRAGQPDPAGVRRMQRHKKRSPGLPRRRRERFGFM